MEPERVALNPLGAAPAENPGLGLGANARPLFRRHPAAVPVWAAARVWTLPPGHFPIGPKALRAVFRSVSLAAVAGQKGAKGRIRVNAFSLIMGKTRRTLGSGGWGLVLAPVGDRGGVQAAGTGFGVGAFFCACYGLIFRVVVTNIVPNHTPSIFMCPQPQYAGACAAFVLCLQGNACSSGLVTWTGWEAD